MRLRSIAGRHRPLLIWGALLGMLGAAATLAQPLVIGELVGAASNGEPLTGLVALTAALFCADAALAALEAYLVGRAGERIVYDIRRVLTGRLLGVDMAAFSRWDSADVLTRMVTDTSMARIAVAQALAQVSTSGLMVVGGLVLMAWIDGWLLSVTLGCLGVAAVASLLLGRRIRIAARRNRDDTSEFASGLQRVLGALTTVKASRAERREEERVGALAREAERSGIRVTAYSAALPPTMNVGVQISLTVVVGWGATRVGSGTLSLADLTAFVTYLFYLVAPLVTLFMALGQLQQGRAAVDRLRELGALEQEEAVAPRGDVPGAEVAGPAVEFDGVTFAYGSEPTLSDVSFTVPKRGLTAIVGPSGAGKTTLFQLVERFRVPGHGTVRLGSADVAALPLARVREVVGYVEQDTPLVRGTIRENLTYANPDAAADDIARALRLASLDGLVASLPDGLDTELGERGAGMSGGERQRLAIARTLLQRPEVILLDEVTAHLDSETEATLRDALREAARECAVLAIAHRMSTIVHADRIIVMEEGRVRAIGTHQQLIASDEVYQRLAGRQFAAEGAPA
ncbi:ABC transporter ATP-binding protein [Streptomyces sp. NPDC048057]|uniref:ABC transporter ATP-binding protein n=1 Tax=Streptomyces sp. NPDC048057 TaxID=3155628 RepID=UPI0033D8F461